MCSCSGCVCRTNPVWPRWKASCVNSFTYTHTTRGLEAGESRTGPSSAESLDDVTPSSLFTPAGEMPKRTNIGFIWEKKAHYDNSNWNYFTLGLARNMEVFLTLRRKFSPLPRHGFFFVWFLQRLLWLSTRGIAWRRDAGGDASPLEWGDARILRERMMGCRPGGVEDGF